MEWDEKLSRTDVIFDIDRGLVDELQKVLEVGGAAHLHQQVNRWHLRRLNYAPHGNRIWKEIRHSYGVNHSDVKSSFPGDGRWRQPVSFISSHPCPQHTTLTCTTCLVLAATAADDDDDSLGEFCTLPGLGMTSLWLPRSCYNMGSEFLHFRPCCPLCLRQDADNRQLSGTCLGNK